jgi:hypothetical protein
MLNNGNMILVNPKSRTVDEVITRIVGASQVGGRQGAIRSVRSREAPAVDGIPVGPQSAAGSCRKPVLPA